MTTTKEEDGSISSKVYSRIGLLGNPSDGYQGACVAVSMSNYWAEVLLTPSASTVQFVPNPDGDRMTFPTVNAFARHIEGHGFYGGLRLLMAITKVLWGYCWDRGIDLPDRGFSLSYSSTIPRQSGLSGSSAIACAALNCLMHHYDISDQLPVSVRPGLVLQAERELGIIAGMMDRVVQTYGGCMFMDFSQEVLRGKGRYQSLDVALIPPLYLIYSMDGASGKDSSQVHSDVRKRFDQGDTTVRLLLKGMADLAIRGKEAIEKGDVHQLATLMNHNFRMRRQLFGDAVLGSRNIHMVEMALSLGGGIGAKLTGSGGAVVAVCPGGNEQAKSLKEVCHAEGLVCELVCFGPEIYRAQD